MAKKIDYSDIFANGDKLAEILNYGDTFDKPITNEHVINARLAGMRAASSDFKGEVDPIFDKIISEAPGRLTESEKILANAYMQGFMEHVNTNFVANYADATDLALMAGKSTVEGAAAIPIGAAKLLGGATSFGVGLISDSAGKAVQNYVNTITGAADSLVSGTNNLVFGTSTDALLDAGRKVAENDALALANLNKDINYLTNTVNQPSIVHAAAASNRITNTTDFANGVGSFGGVGALTKAISKPILKETSKIFNKEKSLAEEIYNTGIKELDDATSNLSRKINAGNGSVLTKEEQAALKAARAEDSATSTAINNTKNQLDRETQSLRNLEDSYKVMLENRAHAERLGNKSVLPAYDGAIKTVEGKIKQKKESISNLSTKLTEHNEKLTAIRGSIKELEDINKLNNISTGSLVNKIFENSSLKNIPNAEKNKIKSKLSSALHDKSKFNAALKDTEESISNLLGSNYADVIIKATEKFSKNSTRAVVGTSIGIEGLSEGGDAYSSLYENLKNQAEANLGRPLTAEENSEILSYSLLAGIKVGIESVAVSRGLGVTQFDKGLLFSRELKNAGKVVDKDLRGKAAFYLGDTLKEGAEEYFQESNSQRQQNIFQNKYAEKTGLAKKVDIEEGVAKAGWAGIVGGIGAAAVTKPLTATVEYAKNAYKDFSQSREEDKEYKESFGTSKKDFEKSVESFQATEANREMDKAILESDIADEHKEKYSKAVASATSLYDTTDTTVVDSAVEEAKGQLKESQVGEEVSKQIETFLDSAVKGKSKIEALSKVKGLMISINNLIQEETDPENKAKLASTIMPLAGAFISIFNDVNHIGANGNIIEELYSGKKINDNSSYISEEDVKALKAAGLSSSAVKRAKKASDLLNNAAINDIVNFYQKAVGEVLINYQLHGSDDATLQKITDYILGSGKENYQNNVNEANAKLKANPMAVLYARALTDEKFFEANKDKIEGILAQPEKYGLTKKSAALLRKMIKFRNQLNKKIREADKQLKSNPENNVARVDKEIFGTSSYDISKSYNNIAKGKYGIQDIYNIVGYALANNDFTSARRFIKELENLSKSLKSKSNAWKVSRQAQLDAKANGETDINPENYKVRYDRLNEFSKKPARGRIPNRTFSTSSYYAKNINSRLDEAMDNNAKVLDDTVTWLNNLVNEWEEAVKEIPNTKSTKKSKNSTSTGSKDTTTSTKDKEVAPKKEETTPTKKEEDNINTNEPKEKDTPNSTGSETVEETKSEQEESTKSETEEKVEDKQESKDKVNEEEKNESTPKESETSENKTEEVKEKENIVEEVDESLDDDLDTPLDDKESNETKSEPEETTPTNSEIEEKPEEVTEESTDNNLEELLLPNEVEPVKGELPIIQDSVHTEEGPLVITVHSNGEITSAYYKNPSTELKAINTINGPLSSKNLKIGNISIKSSLSPEEYKTLSLEATYQSTKVWYDEETDSLVYLSSEDIRGKNTGKTTAARYNKQYKFIGHDIDGKIYITNPKLSKNVKNLLTTKDKNKYVVVNAPRYAMYNYIYTRVLNEHAKAKDNISQILDKSLQYIDKNSSISMYTSTHAEDSHRSPQMHQGLAIATYFALVKSSKDGSINNYLQKNNKYDFEHFVNTVYGVPEAPSNINSDVLVDRVNKANSELTKDNTNTDITLKFEKDESNSFANKYLNRNTVRNSEEVRVQVLDGKPIITDSGSDNPINLFSDNKLGINLNNLKIKTKDSEVDFYEYVFNSIKFTNSSVLDRINEINSSDSIDIDGNPIRKLETYKDKLEFALANPNAIESITFKGLINDGKSITFRNIKNIKGNGVVTIAISWAVAYALLSTNKQGLLNLLSNTDSLVHSPKEDIVRAFPMVDMLANLNALGVDSALGNLDTSVIDLIKSPFHFTKHMFNAGDVVAHNKAKLPDVKEVKENVKEDTKQDVNENKKEATKVEEKTEPEAKQDTAVDNATPEAENNKNEVVNKPIENTNNDLTMDLDSKGKSTNTFDKEKREKSQENITTGFVKFLQNKITNTFVHNVVKFYKQISYPKDVTKAIDDLIDSTNARIEELVRGIFKDDSLPTLDSLNTIANDIDEIISTFGDQIKEIYDNFAKTEKYSKLSKKTKSSIEEYINSLYSHIYDALDVSNKTELPNMLIDYVVPKHIQEFLNENIDKDSKLASKKVHIANLFRTLQVVKKNKINRFVKSFIKAMEILYNSSIPDSTIDNFITAYISQIQKNIDKVTDPASVQISSKTSAKAFLDDNFKGEKYNTNKEALINAIVDSLQELSKDNPDMTKVDTVFLTSMMEAFSALSNKSNVNLEVIKNAIKQIYAIPFTSAGLQVLELEGANSNKNKEATINVDKDNKLKLSVNLKNSEFLDIKELNSKDKDSAISKLNNYVPTSSNNIDGTLEKFKLAKHLVTNAYVKNNNKDYSNVLVDKKSNDLVNSIAYALHNNSTESLLANVPNLVEEDLPTLKKIFNNQLDDLLEDIEKTPSIETLFNVTTIVDTMNRVFNKSLSMKSNKTFNSFNSNTTVEQMVSSLLDKGDMTFLFADVTAPTDSNNKNNKNVNLNQYTWQFKPEIARLAAAFAITELIRGIQNRGTFVQSQNDENGESLEEILNFNVENAANDSLDIDVKNNTLFISSIIDNIASNLKENLNIELSKDLPLKLYNNVYKTLAAKALEAVIINAQTFNVKDSNNLRLIELINYNAKDDTIGMYGSFEDSKTIKEFRGSFHVNQLNAQRNNSTISSRIYISDKLEKILNNVGIEALVNSLDTVLTPEKGARNLINISDKTLEEIGSSSKQLKSGLPINEDAKKALETVNKTKYRIENTTTSVFLAFGEEGIANYMGTAESIDVVNHPDKYNADEYALHTNRVEAIKQSYNGAIGIIKEMQHVSKSTNTPILDSTINFKYNITRVNRFQGENSNDIVSNKITREMLKAGSSTIDHSVPFDFTKPLDATNEKEIAQALYYFAIAQGIGVSVHKLTYETIMSKVSNLINSFLDTESGKQMYEFIKETDGTSFDQLFDLNNLQDRKYKLDGVQLSKDLLKLGIKIDAMVIGYGNAMVALNNLIDITRLEYYKREKPEKLKEFKTSVYLEADGVTNGVLVSQVILNANPEVTEDDISKLYKGFVFLGSNLSGNEYLDFVNNSDEFKNSNLASDNYNTASVVVGQEIASLLEADYFPYQEELKNFMQFFVFLNPKIAKESVNLYELSDTSVLSTHLAEGNIKFTRDHMKKPVTKANYGAGPTAIMMTLFDDFTTSLALKHTKILNKYYLDKERQERIRNNLKRLDIKDNTLLNTFLWMQMLLEDGSMLEDSELTQEQIQEYVNDENKKGILHTYFSLLNIPFNEEEVAFPTEEHFRASIKNNIPTEFQDNLVKVMGRAVYDGIQYTLGKNVKATLDTNIAVNAAGAAIYKAANNILAKATWAASPYGSTAEITNQIFKQSPNDANYSEFYQSYTNQPYRYNGELVNTFLPVSEINNIKDTTKDFGTIEVGDGIFANTYKEEYLNHNPELFKIPDSEGNYETNPIFSNATESSAIAELYGSSGLYTITSSGVGPAPKVTIANGDATMMINFFSNPANQDVANSVTPVFDGLNMPINKIIEVNKSINNEASKNWENNKIFDGVVTFAKQFSQAVSEYQAATKRAKSLTTLHGMFNEKLIIQSSNEFEKSPISKIFSNNNAYMANYAIEDNINEILKLNEYGQVNELLLSIFSHFNIGEYDTEAPFQYSPKESVNFKGEVNNYHVLNIPYSQDYLATFYNKSRAENLFMLALDYHIGKITDEEEKSNLQRKLKNALNIYKYKNTPKAININEEKLNFVAKSRLARVITTVLEASNNAVPYNLKYTLNSDNVEDIMRHFINSYLMNIAMETTRSAINLHAKSLAYSIIGYSSDQMAGLGALHTILNKESFAVSSGLGLNLTPEHLTNRWVREYLSRIMTDLIYDIKYHTRTLDTSNFMKMGKNSDISELANAIQQINLQELFSNENNAEMIKYAKERLLKSQKYEILQKLIDKISNKVELTNEVLVEIGILSPEVLAKTPTVEDIQKTEEVDATTDEQIPDTITDTIVEEVSPKPIVVESDIYTNDVATSIFINDSESLLTKDLLEANDIEFYDNEDVSEFINSISSNIKIDKNSNNFSEIYVKNRLNEILSNSAEQSKSLHDLAIVNNINNNTHGFNDEEINNGAVAKFIPRMVGKFSQKNVIIISDSPNISKESKNMNIVHELMHYLASSAINSQSPIAMLYKHSVTEFLSSIKNYSTKDEPARMKIVKELLGLDKNAELDENRFDEIDKALQSFITRYVTNLFTPTKGKSRGLFAKQDSVIYQEFLTYALTDPEVSALFSNFASFVNLSNKLKGKVGEEVLSLHKSILDRIKNNISRITGISPDKVKISNLEVLTEIFQDLVNQKGNNIDNSSILYSKSIIQDAFSPLLSDTTKGKSTSADRAFLDILTIAQENGVFTKDYATTAGNVGLLSSPDTIHNINQVNSYIKDKAIKAGFNINDRNSAYFDNIMQMFIAGFKIDPSPVITSNIIRNNIIHEDRDNVLTKEQKIFLANPFSKDIPIFNLNNQDSNIVTVALFMALAYSDPEFKAKLNSIKIPKSKNKFDSPIDTLIDSIGTKVMHKLTGLLGDNHKLKSTKHGSTVSSLVDTMINNTMSNYADRYHRHWIPKIMDKADNALISAYTKTAKAVDSVLGQSKNKYLNGVNDFIQTTLDNKLNSHLGEVILTLSSGLYDKMTPVLDLIKDIVGRTKDTEDVYALNKQAKDTVQKVRNTFIAETPRLFKKIFEKAKLKDKDWTNLYFAVGKVDLHTMGVTTDKALSFAFDSSARSAEITNTYNIIQSFGLSDNEMSYIHDKANQLAKFMVTGKAGTLLLRNAKQILLYNKSIKEKILNNIDNFEELTNTLDKYISLSTYEHITKEQSDLIKRLHTDFNNELNSIAKFIVNAKRMEENEANKIDSNPLSLAKLNGYKGYLPSKISNGKSMIIAHISQKNNLQYQGYKLYKPVEGDNKFINSNSKLFYFKRDFNPKGAYNQGAIQLIHDEYNGVLQLTGESRNNATYKVNQKIDGVIIKALNTGKIVGGIDNNSETITPIFDSNLEIVGYDVVSDDTPNEFLKPSTDLAEMLGIYRGRLEESRLVKPMNDIIVDKIYDMYHNSEDKSMFIDITKSKNAIVKDSIKRLPDYVVNNLLKRFNKYSKNGHTPIYIRKDLINDILGERSASIGDVFSGLSNLPKPIQKSVVALSTALLGKGAISKLVKLEKGIQESVSFAKDIIVVKSGIVSIGNIVSNAIQLSLRGIFVPTILKNIPRITHEVHTYNKLRNQNTILELKASSTLNKESAKLLRKQIDINNSVIKSLRIYPLLERGEFSAVGDLDNLDRTVEFDYTNGLSYIEKLANKTPPIMKTIAKYGLITRDTPLYKGLFLLTQYGDFVAKAIYFLDMVENKHIEQKEALFKVADEFVDYDRQTGRTRGYLESMGLLWFYNYKLRVMKSFGSLLKNNPARALMWSVNPLSSMLNSPLTDNVLSQSVAGSLGYTMGPGLLLRSYEMLPAYSLFAK